MAELVGRERELAMLRELLDDARAGRGRVVLLAGEAGIGKTHLIERLAADAAEAGMTVGWGRCTETESPPYWPWRRALRALPSSRAHPLSTNLPGGRDELFAGVADELEVATATSAAALVIEDIHWADPSSLALLRFVIGTVPDLPLLMVLTARDEPSELTEEAASALRDLPPAVHRLPLTGLDANETGRIVRNLCGEDVPDAYVDDVHQRTGGNPFFVHEVATLRALQGESSGSAIPAGVRQVLGRRLARLSQSAHEVLAAGSVAGHDLDAAVLAPMTNRPLDEVVALLDEAVATRLLVRHEDGVTFVHALVREALYADQPRGALAAMHAAAARALEERGPRPAGDGGDGIDAQLAAHWRRASGDDARMRAAHHALAAARGAAMRMGYEQAARYYRWAIDAGPSDPLGVLLALGEAEMMAGSPASGRATLAEVASAALEAGRADELARAVLAMGGGIGGFEVAVGDAEQLRLLEAALSLLPEGDSPLRAALLGRLSVTISGTGVEPRRIELARAAAEMARRVGDADAEVAALAAYCDAVSGPDDIDARLAATARMLELTGSAGSDPRLVLLARRMRIVARFERGEFAAADLDAAAYAATADRLRLPLYQWPVPVWRGMRALMRGEFDAVLEFAAEAEELSRRAGSENGHLMVFALQVGHALSTGASSAMADRFRRVARTLGDYPVTVCYIAGAAIDADRELSLAMVERLRADTLRALARDAEWLEAVWMFGEAGIRHGDVEMARAAYDALTPYEAVWAIDGIGAACFGVTAHQLGRLAAFLGRPDEAATWLRLAIDRHRAAGADHLALLSELAMAALPAASPAAAAAAATSAPPRVALELREGELRREGRVWRLGWAGVSATVPDSKGMRDLAVLVGSPGRQVHVLDLVEGAGGPVARAAGGDTGPVLDRRARDAYRRRLEDLEDELTGADEAGDIGRVAALREERDFLAVELGSALGLGGRGRAAGDRVERARKAVAMRISTALRAISDVHPDLARHLHVSVVTGRFCVYRPEQPARWHTSAELFSRE